MHMTVRRIVPNFPYSDPAQARAFYEGVLGLRIAMDLGWIVTYADASSPTAQVSVASEGGCGTPVPDISVEVDDVDETYRLARSNGFEIVYELVDEPWGVRRFFVREPSGRIVNVLSHLRD
jgi:lactoylglutathione lyase